MTKYVAGIDAGTMGVRCVIFDPEGKEIASAYYETPTKYPRPGWVEQNAQDIIDLAYKSCKDAIAQSGVSPKDIAGISFTNQRSTFVPIDKQGNYLRPDIIWQDTRGAEFEKTLPEKISNAELYRRTGLPISTIWPMLKILWVKKYEPDVFNKTYKFLMVQEMLVKAFGGRDYIGDLADSNWWQITNLDTFKYDQGLADIFGVDLSMFPENVDPGTVVGEVTAEVAEKSGLALGTPVIIGAGDQQCGVVGAGVVFEGMASVTLGTAGLAIAYSPKSVRDPNLGMMILGHAGTHHWEIEGITNAAASSYRWFRDNLGQLEVSASKLAKNGNPYALINQQVAESPVGAHGLLFLPYLAAAGTPHYDSSARGTFVGLTLGHTRGDVARSIMEGICLEMRDVIENQRAAGVNIEKYRITGGATRSPLWNQMQADVYGRPVETLAVTEVTALGAAIFAAVGSGLYKDVYEATKNMVHPVETYTPNTDNTAVYDELYNIFAKTYQALKGEAYPLITAFQAKHM